jgi:hypothetical protein
MRSIFRFLWVVPVLALGSGLFLGAADESPSRAKGTVLILRKSEGTMEGDIRRKNGEYIVKRNMCEITWPAKDVLALCEDWDQACDFMKSRVKKGDVESHLQFARWCDINNRPLDAFDAAEAALSLQPDHEKAARYCTIFKKKLEAAKTQVEDLPLPSEPTLPPVPVDEVSPEVKQFFSSRVQPILLQRCVECHNLSNKSTKFQLYRPFDGNLPQTTVRNMHAALMQIDRDNRKESPLLQYAPKLHGGLTLPAIRGQRDLQFGPLKEWVDSVVEDRSNNWSTRNSSQIIAPTPTRSGLEKSPQPTSRQPAIESEDSEPTASGFFSGGIPVSTTYDPTNPYREENDRGTPTPNFRDDAVNTASKSKSMESTSLRPPPFPSGAARPRQTAENMPVMLASVGKGLPPFPAIAGRPRDLPRPVRQGAIPSSPPKNQAPKVQAPVAVPSMAFQFHPAPMPVIEMARPEPATDEFDPGAFNQPSHGPQRKHP